MMEQIDVIVAALENGLMSSEEARQAFRREYPELFPDEE